MNSDETRLPHPLDRLGALGEAVGPFYTDDELEAGFAEVVALAEERRKDPIARRAAEDSVLSAKIGIDAHALGVNALEAGDLDNAERWLKIAIDHGAEHARDDLDQVRVPRNRAQEADEPCPDLPFWPSAAGRVPTSGPHSPNPRPHLVVSGLVPETDPQRRQNRWAFLTPSRGDECRIMAGAPMSAIGRVGDGPIAIGHLALEFDIGRRLEALKKREADLEHERRKLEAEKAELAKIRREMTSSDRPDTPRKASGLTIVHVNDDAFGTRGSDLGPLFLPNPGDRLFGSDKWGAFKCLIDKAGIGHPQTDDLRVISSGYSGAVIAIKNNVLMKVVGLSPGEHWSIVHPTGIDHAELANCRRKLLRDRLPSVKWRCSELDRAFWEHEGEFWDRDDELALGTLARTFVRSHHGTAHHAEPDLRHEVQSILQRLDRLVDGGQLSPRQKDVISDEIEAELRSRRSTQNDLSDEVKILRRLPSPVGT